MRLCRFNANRLGVVEDDAILDVTAALDVLPEVRWPLPSRGDLLIQHLDAVRSRVAELVEQAERHEVSDVKILSPVANPSKLIAAPVNYRLHVDEANADKGISFDQPKLKSISELLCFLKAVSALVGPGEGVTRRFPDRRTDHEIELAVIIGHETNQIEYSRALECVAGYAIGLDMTVRGKEERSLRKSIDSYAVLGPWLVTKDEIEDPDNLHLTLRVNGEVRQDAGTDELIYDVKTLISKISEFYTLYPGDVLYTGTPAGVGPVMPGDVMDCEIEGIGRMEVAVVDASS